MTTTKAAAHQPFGQRPLLSLPAAHKGVCHIVRYDANGRYLLSGGADRTIKLWNAAASPQPSSSSAAQPIKVYQGAHSHEILALDITRDNARFASGGPDKAVMLWDVPTSTVLRRFSAHQGTINDVRFAGSSNDGAQAQVLCTAGFDGVLRFYDLRAQGAWRPILEAKDARDAIQTICLGGQDGASVWTGSVDGVVRQYDLRKGTLTQDTVDEPVVSLSLSSGATGGQLLLVSTSDSTHRLLDVADGSLLQSFTGHKNEAYRCHSTLSSPIEDQVVAGDEEGKLRTWDLVTGKQSQALDVAAGAETTIPPRSARSRAVMWTECNPRKEGPLQIVTGGADGAVHVWSA